MYLYIIKLIKNTFIMTTTNTNDVAKDFISNEMDLRMKLIESPEFIQTAIKVAKQMGITANEWNNNMGMILLLFANEVIGIDNQNGKELRAIL